MQWRMEEVARSLGVVVPQGLDPLARLVGVSIDSRTIRAGELFIAIRGPRHDGHSFVAQALAAGALAGMVARERLGQYAPEVRSQLFGVEDTFVALQKLARAVARAWRVSQAGRRIAAVTGSAGKTTTKEILSALLAARLRVLKSEGNLNNEYGLPLTLLRLEESHEAAVIELGMSRRGELERLADIVEPEVGVVTNVAPVHLEFFSSVDEIALAKRELIEGLAGKDPVAVLNQDDPRVARFGEGFRGRVRRYGLAREAEFRAERISDRGVHGSAFDFISPVWRTRLELPLVGRHNILNALAGLAAASEWDISAREAQTAFAGVKPAAMRGEVLRFPGGIAVLNDSYNSNPLALAQMVELLRSMPGHRRRILVAGEMLELGPSSPELHYHAGRNAAESRRIDWIIGVAGQARDLVRGAVEAGHPQSQAEFFETSDEAAKFLTELVGEGDVVLVKGSRGVRMEGIVETLCKHHEAAASGSKETVRAGRQKPH